MGYRDTPARAMIMLVLMVRYLLVRTYHSQLVGPPDIVLDGCERCCQ